MRPISPKPFRPRTVDKRINDALLNRKLAKQSKHSTGDWDFSGIDWTLGTVRYVSAPSSLRTNKTGAGGGDVVALVKTATVPIVNVKEGRIITYMRGMAADCAVRQVFRWQDASNYYFAEARVNDDFRIGRVYGGVTTYFQEQDMSAPHTFYADAWYRTRATWWNDYVGLVIRLEYWSDDAWVKPIADGYDSNNYWRDIGGRVGLMLHEMSVEKRSWADDTEIYGIP